jgi:hypothetical protein
MTRIVMKRYKAEDLKRALSSLSPEETVLDLTPRSTAPAKYKEIFEVLTLIADKWGEDYKKSGAELAAAFSVIPNNIQEITLCFDDISHLTHKELVTLGRSLPYVMKLNIINELEQDKFKVALLLKHVGSQRFDLYKEIYEQLLEVKGSDGQFILPEPIAREVINSLVTVDRVEFDKVIRAKPSDCGFFGKICFGVLGGAVISSALYTLV